MVVIGGNFSVARGNSDGLPKYMNHARPIGYAVVRSKVQWAEIGFSFGVAIDHHKLNAPISTLSILVGNSIRIIFIWTRKVFLAEQLLLTKLSTTVNTKLTHILKFDNLFLYILLFQYTIKSKNVLGTTALVFGRGLRVLYLRQHGNLNRVCWWGTGNLEFNI